MANTTGAEISRIVLTTFCSTDKSRAAIMAPFRIGEWTYATDGRILIRVSAIDYPACVNEKAPKADSIMKWAHSKDAADWSSLPACFDDIKLETVDCEHCLQGTKTCPHCQHESDCLECDGDGVVTTFIPPHTRIGQFKIDSFYAVKLRDFLPDVQVWLHPAFDCHGPIQFRFDGGLGYLMPMRQPGKVDY